MVLKNGRKHNIYQRLQCIELQQNVRPTGFAVCDTKDFQHDRDNVAIIRVDGAQHVLCMHEPSIRKQSRISFQDNW